jgi:hypothetical protein
MTKEHKEELKERAAKRNMPSPF